MKKLLACFLPLSSRLFSLLILSVCSVFTLLYFATTISFSENIRRLENFSIKGEASGAYFCENCCDRSVTDTEIQPETREIEVGENASFSAFEWFQSCNGAIFRSRVTGTGSTSNLVWQSSDPQIATVSQTGQITALEDGEVEIFATWQTSIVYSEIIPNCGGGELIPLAKEEKQKDNNINKNQSIIPSECIRCYTLRESQSASATLIVKPPQVTIDLIDSVEVNGTRIANVHVSKNGSNNILVVSLAVPQGQPQRATFEDGSTFKYIAGGNGDFSYTIKGALASEQIDDFNIRVFPQRSQGGGSYAIERFTITSVMFSQAADCSGFDAVENPPYLFVPQNGNNTAKAKIIPNGASGNFNLQAQQGITISPTTITSGEQTITVTGGNTTGTFTLQALANQSTQAAATLNVTVRRRINKTVVIHAITEDNDDEQSIPVGTTVGRTTTACVTAGSNGFRDTIPGGDDQVLTESLTNIEYVSVGANRICDTTANSTDTPPPSSANIPSASALQTALNNTYWGKQANIYFTIITGQTRQINYDLDRDNLISSEGGNEPLAIHNIARDSSADFNLYYLGLNVKTLANGNTPSAFSNPTFNASWFSPTHNGTIEYIAAHEIGHLLGASGTNVAEDLMYETDSSNSPCRIRKRDWDLVNPLNP